MSSIIAPECNLPPYQQTLPTAEKCAATGAYFLAGFLSVITIIFSISIYQNEKGSNLRKINDEDKRRFANNFTLVIIIIIDTFLFLFFWMVIPSINIFFSKNQWHTLDMERCYLREQGLSEKEIVNFMQQNYLTQQQIRASQSQANIIASAIAANKKR